MTGDSNGRLDHFGAWAAWRDDLYERGGSRGGKVRTCWQLAQSGKPLVTAGARHSPQVGIVAGIAAILGVPCRVHVPAGGTTPEIEAAAAHGAQVIRHRPGYNTVIVKRAADDAQQRGWQLIPFGMEHQQAITEMSTAAAWALTHTQPDRLVVPVGSGMTLAGLLHGVPDSLPVLGVQVGADPTKRLDRWAPTGWRDRVHITQHPSDYSSPVQATLPNGDTLDPHYEAKCLEHVQPNDLLWIVGLRQTA